MALTRPISKAIRERIAQDPYYKKCARANEDCKGRITVDHAVMYAGTRLDDYWSLIPTCWEHHLGKHFSRNINQAIAYSRATDEDLKKYPKLSIKHARAIQKLFLP